MKDFVARGTGNSRFLKSVPDFLKRYPTYADFAQALIDGTFPFDNNGLNQPGVTETGTPYSKATTVPDNIAQAYGLDPRTATIASVFNVLTSAALVDGKGAITDLSGNSNVGPVWISAYRADGVYPKKISCPFAVRCAILQGAATGSGVQALSLIRGSDAVNASITLAGKSGITTNAHAYVDNTNIVLSADPGGEIAGAHNVVGSWNFVIAFR